MAPNRPFSIIKELPSKPGLVHFMAERSACSAAQKVSLTDWRKWLPKAQPPFERMLIEWKPFDMIKAFEESGQHSFMKIKSTKVVDNKTYMTIDSDMSPEYDDLFDSEAILVENHRISFLVGSAAKPEKGRKRSLLLLPFCIDLLQERIDDQTQKDFEKFVWGLNYDKTLGFGLPNVRIDDHPAYAKLNLGPMDKFVDNAGMTYLPHSVLPEFGGIARFSMSLLALINAEREHEEILYPEARTIGKGVDGLKKLPPVRLIVIRPDTVQKVYEPHVTHEPVQRRDHGVRRHLRHYKNGKTVWVREHRRGDPALGTVKQEYIVEMDPNREVNL